MFAQGLRKASPRRASPKMPTLALEASAAPLQRIFVEMPDGHVTVITSHAQRSPGLSLKIAAQPNGSALPTQPAPPCLRNGPIGRTRPSLLGRDVLVRSCLQIRAPL